MTKPIQETDVEVVEDFDIAELLPWVLLDKKYRRNRTEGCHLTFKSPQKKRQQGRIVTSMPILACKEKHIDEEGRATWKVCVRPNPEPWNASVSWADTENQISNILGTQNRFP